MKERLANTIRRSTSMRQLMHSVWAGLLNGLKDDITEISGEIVVVWTKI